MGIAIVVIVVIALIITLATQDSSPRKKLDDKLYDMMWNKKKNKK